MINLPLFKNNRNEVYLGLFLKEKEGIGFIIDLSKKEKIIKWEKFKYSNDWNNLLEDVDEVLLHLETETKIHIKKTIFFLFSHLIDKKTNDVKKENLAKIKELVKNLELEPLGYVEAQEAVVFLKEKEEKSPLTAILVELDEKYLDFFIFKSGKKVFQETVSRGSKITEDIYHILSSFKEKIVLPSRIIIYNSSDLTDAASEIMVYHWHQDIFIQSPRVEVIKEERLLENMADVFSKQLNLEVTDDKQKITEKKEEIEGFVIGEDVVSQQTTEKKITTKKIIIFFQNFTKKIVFKLPGKNYGTVIIGLFFLIFSIFSLEFFAHKAKINLIFKLYKIEKDDIFLPELSTATTSAEIKQTKKSTGTKKIGSNGRGEITIFNFDNQEKTFTKGTIFEAKGLKFTLDENVTVSSSTLAADLSSKTPGKSQGKLTAQDIGGESNLEKNSQFKIADLPISLFIATNETDFSGGSSKEIMTVSKKDMEDLKTTVLNTGKNTIEKKIKLVLSSQNELIPDLTNYSLTNIIFSKEIGEETDSLAVSAKVGAAYSYFPRVQLISFIKKKLSNEIPKGYFLVDEKINYKIEKIEIDKNKVSLKLKIEAKAEKKIDKEKIKARLTGKYQTRLKKIIEEETGSYGYDFIITPNILFLQSFTPLFKKNIELTVSYQ